MNFRLHVLVSLIFLSSRLFGQTIPKNWFEKDHLTDSLAGISLDKAYELLKDRISKTVIVAVIDNGVDTEHEDLKNKIWTNTKEIPDNGIDDDRNGYIDDVHGWNFRGTKNGIIVENEQMSATQLYVAWKDKYDNVNINKLNENEKKELNIHIRAKKQFLEKGNSKDSTEFLFSYNANYNSSKLIANDSEDLNNCSYGSPHYKLSRNLSHGTHVAGIVAADRNNDKGINGIVDNVLIMPITATTAVGDERDKDIANAIHYAVDNGARIINMSFSKMFSPDKRMVDEAITYAKTKNVLIVHEAGNDGMNIDSAKNYHYPVAIFQNGKR